MADRKLDNGRCDVFINGFNKSRASFFRRCVMEAHDSIPGSHNIMALTEFDVTEIKQALKIIRTGGRKVSLFSYVIKAISLAIAENREFNSSRNRRGSHIIEFRDIDVNIPVELKLKTGEKIPLRIVIRNADEKDVEDIAFEIQEAKNGFRHFENEGIEKRAIRMIKMLYKLPKILRTFTMKKMITDPMMIKKMEGTVFITPLGMFGNLPGFAIPYIIGPRAISFALGSVVKKPVVIGNEILIRDMLSITLIVNHDIIDGAQAARFINRLKKIIEFENLSLIQRQ